MMMYGKSHGKSNLACTCNSISCNDGSEEKTQSTHNKPRWHENIMSLQCYRMADLRPTWLIYVVILQLLRSRSTSHETAISSTLSLVKRIIWWIERPPG